MGAVQIQNQESTLLIPNSAFITRKALKKEGIFLVQIKDHTPKRDPKRAKVVSDNNFLPLEKLSQTNGKIFQQLGKFPKNLKYIFVVLRQQKCCLKVVC